MLVSTPTVVAEYEYRLRLANLWLLAAFIIPGTILMTYFAVTLDRPLQAKGFPLTAEQGRMFFGCFAVLSFVGLMMLACFIGLTLVAKRRVVVTPTSLVLPRPSRSGYSSDEIEIPWTSIHAVSIEPFIGSTQLIRIGHAEGVIHIPSNMLPDEQKFEELAELVQRLALQSA